MLTTAMDSIRESNAKFARDVEYVKETANDDIIDARVEMAEAHFNNETISELEEAAAMVDRLSSEENVVEEKAEIDRILNADENLTFEEMVGIEE
mgnify:CR=1 FL=1